VRAVRAQTVVSCSRLSTESDRDLVKIGRVGRPHGVDGAFVVEEASEDPTRFEVGASLLLDGEPAEVVLSRRVGRGRQAIRLDRSAERGAELSIPRRDLPPAEPGSFYVVDLIGLAVEDDAGRALGVVRDVLPGPANDNLELESGVLVPLVEDAVAEIDLDTRRVVLNSGYIE
jgi:16S rRNA processing protein RimM